MDCSGARLRVGDIVQSRQDLLDAARSLTLLRTKSLETVTLFVERQRCERHRRRLNKPCALQLSLEFWDSLT